MAPNYNNLRTIRFVCCFTEYKDTLINLANYPLIMFAMAKIMEMNSKEQIKVALYLFYSIDYQIEKMYKHK